MLREAIGRLGEIANRAFYEAPMRIINPDLFHYRYHMTTMHEALEELSDAVGLSEREHVLLTTAIDHHDIGYVAANPYIFRKFPGIRKFHTLPVLNMIQNIDLPRKDNEEILAGIVLHDRDVLPAGVPRWMRYLRDIDRTVRLGDEGALMLGFDNELGYSEYEDMRDVEFARDEHGLLPLQEVRERIDQIFPFGYEDFVREKLIPDMRDMGLAGVAAQQATAWVKRFDGETRSNIVVGWDTNNWEIEPVSHEVREVFGYRRDQTLEIIELLTA